MPDNFEDYMSQWLDYKRKQHIQNQFNRESPLAVPGVQRKATPQELENMRVDLNNLNRSISQDSLSIVDKVSKLGPEQSVDDLLNNDSEASYIAQHLWEKARDKYVLTDNLKNGYICTGSNCTYNATIGYHPTPRVSDLKANPEQYGFKRITNPNKTFSKATKEAEPGDVVIYPMGSHAGTYVGDGRYNWSSGGMSKNDWVLNGRDPGLDMGIVYRFVGTPQDSAQVRKDFEAGVEIPKVTVTPRRQTHYQHPDFDKMADTVIDSAIDAGLSKGNKVEHWSATPQYIFPSIF